MIGLTTISARLLYIQWISESDE